MTADIGQGLTDEYLANFKSTVNNELNPVKYLAIDPGKSNGVCGYDAKFYVQFMLTIQADDMVNFLDQFDRVEKCITESFTIFPNIPGQKRRTPVYSDMETSRVIGRIESWSNHKNIELIMQPPNIKTTGYKWTGIKQPTKSDPTNHMQDAHIHFMYWAVVHGYIKAEDLLRRGSSK